MLILDVKYNLHDYRKHVMYLSRNLDGIKTKRVQIMFILILTSVIVVYLIYYKGH